MTIIFYTTISVRMTKTIKIARTLKDATIHSPTDNMYLLLKKGYAILDDKNVHIKIKQVAKVEQDINKIPEIKTSIYIRK